PSACSAKQATADICRNVNLSAGSETYDASAAFIISSERDNMAYRGSSRFGILYYSLRSSAHGVTATTQAKRQAKPPPITTARNGPYMGSGGNTCQLHPAQQRKPARSLQRGPAGVN